MEVKKHNLKAQTLELQGSISLEIPDQAWSAGLLVKSVLFS